jgi:hypothetical protein
MLLSHRGQAVKGNADLDAGTLVRMKLDVQHLMRPGTLSTAVFAAFVCVCASALVFEKMPLL